MHETFKNNVIYAVLHILRQFMKHVSNPPPFDRARICLRQTRIFMRGTRKFSKWYLEFCQS